MNEPARPVVILGVTGGIAAYKAATVLKHLRDAVETTVVMTRAAQRFVTPLTFAALTGKPVLTDLFSESESGRAIHIALADRARCLVIAPATANLLAKLAHGLADDTLSTVALSVACPVVLAPAMNTRMWNHPMTQANVARLRACAYHFVEPEAGWLADGHEGPGRLAEESAIAATVLAAVRGELVPPHAPSSPSPQG